MAASDNMASTETFRSIFENSWISEAFARDTEILTKALTVSISSHPATSSPPPENVSYPKTPTSVYQQQQQRSVQNASSSGGSDPETPSVSKLPPRKPASTSGRISKRKSRASKRSLTTFITADPANFRQMVQQVTGVHFGPDSVPVLKPEPQRPGLASRLQGVGGGCLLPTLDTSAFLLDHHQQGVDPTNAMSGTQRSGPLGYGSSGVVAQAGGPGFDFDGLSCFPTLESWKVK